MTLEGYIAGSKGEMDWMLLDWDDALKKYVTAITTSVDCIILGRKLAQGFIPHWAAKPEQEGADKMNNTAKVVFTKTLDKSEWPNTGLAKGNLVDEITQLKKQPVNDIIVYSGANFVSALIKEGLNDEYHLFINPTSIGNGIKKIKEPNNKLNLALVKSTSFACGLNVHNFEQKSN